MPRHQLLFARFVICCVSWAFNGTQNGYAQFDYDEPPISYDECEPMDRIRELAKELASGETTLAWSRKHGWLPSVLAALDVPQSSQTLVFSKTSQQIRRIDPSRPRALYFNSSVYVGWVQNGDFIELAAVDPEQGAMFYTLRQEQSEQPQITRDKGQCLSCHSTSRTDDVPGFLIRSTFVKPDGHPDFRLGTITTDHTTPLVERFGGWFVTGSHGEMRHRGNVLISGDDDCPIDPDAGDNLDRLPAQVRSEKYLKPTSDIVALMLLEHQTQFHNHVTKASYECRQAVHYQTIMNRVLERGKDHETDATRRRIQRAAEDLVKYLLFADEFRLTAPIRGNPEFAEEFVSRGVKDQQGRSLRDLDLETRLLKYPCSYLIYTPSFLALPDPVLKVVKTRMAEILNGLDPSDDFVHLSATDRQNIRDILAQTHPLFRSD